MRSVLAALLLLAGLPAWAQQRASEALVDCAALVDAPNLRLASGTAPDGAAAALASAFRDAATAEAAAEGRPDPRAFVDRMLAAKRAMWLDRGPALPRTQEYRDRIALCRAMARDRGIGAG